MHSIQGFKGETMTPVNAAVAIPRPARQLSHPHASSDLRRVRHEDTDQDESPSSAGLARLSGKLTVVIVDRQRLFAEAMHSVLEDGGFEVLALATTGQEGLQAVARQCPDITLVSHELPDMTGIELGEALIERKAPTKIVGVSTIPDAALEREALKAGLSGLVSKQVAPGELLWFIRAVAEGRAAPASRATSTNARSWSELLGGQLTGREHEVLAMLVEGASGRMIARRLGISENTVRTHVQNLLTKLQVGSRLEAVAYAVRHGLVTRTRG
jgi:two-component system, NarL family, response regulator LiaR